MNIIIVGAGIIGRTLAKLLSFDGHFVTVIDVEYSAIANVKNKIDVETVVGNAIDIDVLQNSGADNADMIIAVTGNDEVNIVVCQIAEIAFKIDNKIALVNNAVYYKHNFLFSNQKLSINFAVSSNIEIANMIEKSILVPGVLEFNKSLSNNVFIIKLINEKKTVFTNIPVKFVNHVANNYEFAIISIERDGQSFIPKTNEIIRDGDKLQIAVNSQNIEKLLVSFGYTLNEEKNVIIIGGNSITEKIINHILNSRTNIKFKILEHSRTEAEKLAQNLQNTEVFTGNFTDADLFDEMDVSKSHSVIAMTNNDLINIFACLMAKESGAHCVAALLRDTQNKKSLFKLGINVLLDIKQAIIDKIIQYIKNKNIYTVTHSIDNNIEVIEVQILNRSRTIGMNIDDLGDDIVIAALLRDNDIKIMPTKCVIKSGDHLLLSAEKSAIKRISALFEENPTYLS